MLRQELTRIFADGADKELVAFRGRRGTRVALSGTELQARSQATAQVLRDWLGKGPRVVVLALPAGPEFLTAFFGAVLARVTVVPVPVPRPGSNSTRFQHIVTDCGASVVLCLPTDAERIRAALTGGEATSCPVVPLPLDPASLPEPLGPDHPNATLPTLIQYTSGSTRVPKGVLISGQNIIENAQVVQRAWGLDGQSRVVNWLPHYHDMGLMGGILYPLLAGGFSAQIDPLDFIRKPALWLQVIAGERASFSGGAAFGFAECIRRIPAAALDGLDLSCWSRAFCGAEPVAAGLLQDFHAHLAATGLRREALFACYGLAEMTLFAAGVPGPPPANADLVDPCRLTPELAANIAIVDPEVKTLLTDGCEGEIWLKGASTGAGYHNLAAETAETFGQMIEDHTTHDRITDDRTVWLRTGDIGKMTADRLEVIGRIKDVIICNGRKIAAPEIEWIAAEAHSSLNPMAIAAFMADPNQSGSAVVIAETHMGKFVGDEAARVSHSIRQTALGEWGLDLIDVLFVPRGRLERTSSGKIKRAAVAQAWRTGEFGDLQHVGGQGHDACEV